MEHSSATENRERRQFVREARAGWLGRYRLLVYSMAFVFAVSGVVKLAGVSMALDAFESWGLPPWMVPLVGAAELVGALFLALSRHAYVGALVLGFVMAGAVVTHLVNGEFWFALVPVALLAGLADVFYQQAPKPTWFLPKKGPRATSR